MYKKMLLVFAVILVLSVNILVQGSPEKRPEFVQDEVIVKLKQNADLGSLDFGKLEVKSHKKLVVNENKHLKKYGLDRLYLLKVKDKNVDKAVRSLNRDPNVEYAEPNYIVTINIIPNDPDFSNLYGMHNTGQTGGMFDADIDAVEAWDIRTGSSNVVVAVIDSGVDYGHEDLAANMWVNINEIANNSIDDDNNGYVDDYLGWDFYNEDNDPFDDNGHGTHVSGTIGGVGNNGIGVAGVSWDVQIMPLKFLNSAGSGSTTGAIAAIEYATLMGVDIMSNSWGGGGFSQALEDAISAANDAGILFVAAAGNSNSNNDISAYYPSSYDVPNVVAVAATDHNDNKASFSSYGANTVDLGAPGDLTYSTVPTGSCSLCSLTGYTYLSGTSMATPHVSGAAALIISQFPGMSVLDIKTRLLSGVDQLTSLESITLTGGRLNVYNSLENDTIPPGAISDLAATDTGFNSVILVWTATGDDGSLGTASSYDLRYSTSLIDATNFDSAAKAANLPNPQVSGSSEAFTVTGLLSSTTYYFAIKAGDNVGNKGDISNIASETTGEPAILFSDDFESGGNGWTATSLWHQETVQSYSPITSWTYNSGAPNYNYDIGANSGTLTSPEIDLTNTSSAILRFYGLYQTETDGATYDQRWVQISVNGGAFTNLVQLSGEAMNIWHQHEVDLSAYAGNSIQARFFFNTIDGVLNNYWGWSIDDFTVFGDTGIPPPPNDPPVADANGPYSGTEGIAIVFDGSGSFDPDNDTLTYDWNFGDGAVGSGVAPSHTYVAGGNYTVILVVNDGKVDSIPSTTTAEITNVNNAPTANAGADQILSDADGNGIENTFLFGNNSFDTDGFIVSYEWFENAVLIASGANPVVDFTVGVHNVTLKVTDNEASTGTDSVVITVNPNQAPTSNAGPDQAVTDSDNNGVESVTLDGSSSFDPDGGIVSYEWKEGASVLGTSAALTSSFAVGTHTVTLTVTDNGGLSSSDNVVVTVNQATVIDIVTIIKAQYKNKNSQLTVEALSDDSGAVLTVAGYGTLTKKGDKWILRQRNVPDPGATVTVTSSGGGSDTAIVSHS